MPRPRPPIYARWNKYWNGPTNATYTIYHGNGSTVVVGNQQPVGGPDWHFLATVSLAPGQNHRVALSAQSNGSVAANAIAVVAVDAPASAATWQTPMTTAGDYGLYLKWPYYNQLNPAATYSIVHGEGTSNVLVDQRAITNPTPWISLGLVPWAPNEDHRVDLLPRLEYEVVADAIAVAATPIAATWTPTLPVPDTYTVSAWWAAASTNHPQATYHIYNAGGTSRVTVNQTQNGGQWQVLGTYVMQPGQNHRVVLANQVGATVVADAIKLTAAGSPRTATWGLPVTTTGTYDIYARWPADAINATNATYTVRYAGGTTVVPMNQTTNGGQWNLLGTFTLNPVLNPMVELSDEANGRVVADAVMVVPNGVSTDHVTYTPTLTTSGTLDIYAKWTESATRAQAVTYTVQHAGGATDILVNQQQPSAGWFSLEFFTLSLE